MDARVDKLSISVMDTVSVCWFQAVSEQENCIDYRDRAEYLADIPDPRRDRKIASEYSAVAVSIPVMGNIACLCNSSAAG